MENTEYFIVSAIEIGANSINMKISEVGNNGIKEIEFVSSETMLGYESFNYGKIKFKTMAETCEILIRYKRLMQDYGVLKYRAVATSVLREVDNREYIIDQIFLKTGIKINILENTEERWLTYKAIKDRLEDYEKLREKGLLIADIGSSSLEITQYGSGNLISSFNFPLGSQKLRNDLSDIERETLYFQDIVEEYLDVAIDRLHVFLNNEYSNHFIGLAREIYPLVLLYNKNIEKNSFIKIKKEDFFKMSNNLKKYPIDELCIELDINVTQANLLLPLAITLKKLINLTNADEILIPMVSLYDGIIADFYDQTYKNNRQQIFNQDIIGQARNYGKKFKYDENHARAVETNSLLLFDSLRNIHGLDSRHRMILQIAAILHDIGKFINFQNHYEHSYQIIKSLNILGLSENDINLAASIARYHSNKLPNINHENLRMLSMKDRVSVSKLSAIIRIADSLDKSHLQKIKDIFTDVSEKEICIKISSNKDTFLEESTFKKKSQFFAEVFGILPKLIKKRND